MKKFLALVMAAVMVFAFAACGSTDNGGAKPTDSPKTDTPTTGGDTTETIKLGGIGPLTGGYANYGLSVKTGAELAVKEINAAGGINGKQIELNFQDSQSDPESAVNAYGKLMDWGMDVSLGTVFSGVSSNS